MVRPISAEEEMLAAGHVLGDLSTAEATEFEAALAQNPALQAEVAALEVALNQLPQGLTPVSPPPPLKAQIVESFVAAASPNSFVSVPSPSLSVPIEITNNRLSLSRILAGVGLLIGGLLAFDNFNLRQELQVAQQVNRQDLASVLSKPKSRLLALSNQEGIVGNVLFTPGNWKQIIVSAQNLPPLPVDRVYRMWLELANGQVIPCGEFKTDDRNSIFIQLNAAQQPPAGVKAKGVFITIDQSTDPLQPTGNRVIQGTI